MDKKCIEITIGSLLHDVGKVLYRYNDGRNHSISGHDFLREMGIDSESILNQVKYHHKKMLSGASLKKDDLAYITYWADNVASAADRRENEDTDEYGYDKYVPLSTIFNILNDNQQDYAYELDLIYDSGVANDPKPSVQDYSKTTYSKLIENLKDGLAAIELNEAYVNSLLSVLESNFSFVPSSTDKSQLCDISLYDHCKVTAAIASCAYNYFTENNIADYKEAVYKNEKSLNEQNIFQLISMDISGIQEYIFLTASDDALKLLRSKSFYLEIMLEHIVDELLDRIGLSRANLIYSGGGHAYILVDNSEKTNQCLEQFNKELKKWYLENFRTELFIAIGQEPCSANSLMNKPDGSYKSLFQSVSRKVSEIKNARYDAEEILALNRASFEQYERECKVCGNLNEVNEDGVCPMCQSLIDLSANILKKNFISVLTEKAEERCVKLPFDRYMVMEDEEQTRKRINSDNHFLRSYSKNRMFTGANVATKIWTGDYHKGDSFRDLANAAEGIKRIGVLRADVDNLGKAFVSGFERADGSQRYVSLSRSATFSRKMSMFFKLHLNDILQKGRFSLDENGEVQLRDIIIIYSGGDDLFLVGAWNDIVEAAVDIQGSLERFTQGTLSISAGIGLFPEKFPVRSFAKSVGELEDAAKGVDGKNSVAIFDDSQVYKWSQFKDCVIGEKYDLIRAYFNMMPEKGMSAIYNLLEYIREKDEKINIARFAYLLGRMEPEKKASDEQKEIYQQFAKKMYQWIKDEKDCKELITAIYIYVYLNRKKEG